MKTPAGRRAGVVGGSIGGLTAALLLRDAGWEVDVFERSAVLLEGRGGGIVAHPATIRYLVERAGLAVAEISASATWLRYLGADGGIAHEEPCRYRFTSYDALYRRLLDRFDHGRYHLGEECVGVDADGGGRRRLAFASGREASADLVVFADGINSVGRRFLSPGSEPVYAGYVAWRGTITEEELGPAEFEGLASAITYRIRDDGHAISYPIPSRGPRLLNWLWYRNVPAAELGSLTGEGDRIVTSVPPGLVPPDQAAALRRRARAELPQVTADVIERTPAPYIQVIVDVESDRMAAGRVCLIGDGAFTARPHIAIGTAKAAEDAWTLAAALEGADDLDAALAAWSDRQVALGAAVVGRAREAGIRLQTGSWRAGEPLPYGLYTVGDSSIADTGGSSGP